jgi:hypothetical protein
MEIQIGQILAGQAQFDDLESLKAELLRGRI